MLCHSGSTHSVSVDGPKFNLRHSWVGLGKTSLWNAGEQVGTSFLPLAGLDAGLDHHVCSSGKNDTPPAPCFSFGEQLQGKVTILE